MAASPPGDIASAPPSDAKVPVAEGAPNAPPGASPQRWHVPTDPPHWQGAEARVHIVAHGDGRAVLKERFAKDYRHAVLDTRLRRSRTALEARCLARALAAGVSVPGVIAVRKNDGVLVVDHVPGDTVRDALRAGREWPPVADAAGTAIGRLHVHAGIVHGDLTTSNMIVRDADGGLVLIDFGMAEASASAEDRAVDLYVLQRALLSTHPAIGDAFFARALEAYRAAAGPGAEATLARLAAVQLRGRKRDMAG